MMHTEICFALCKSPSAAFLRKVQVVKNQVCDIQARLVPAR